MSGIARQGADDRLVTLLASGRSVADAAQEVGLSEATAFRRLRDADFVRQLSIARAALWDAALGALSNASVRAVTTLVALLNSESDTVKLAAAKCVLDLGTKLRESCDFDTRLAILEEARDERATSTTNAGRTTDDSAV